MLLDNGGVLTLPRPEVVAEILEGVIPEVDPAAVPRAHDAAMRAYDAGYSIEDAYRGFRETFVRALGAPDVEHAGTVFDAAVATDGHLIWRQPRDGAHEGLRALDGLGVPIAIVSNAFGTVEHDLRELGLCQAGPGPGVEVATVVDSGLVGVEKPDPEIFHLALERLGGIAPEHAIHIGDSVVADVSGARGAGLGALHFDPSRLCDDTSHGHLHALADLPTVLGL